MNTGVKRTTQPDRQAGTREEPLIKPSNAATLSAHGGRRGAGVARHS
ncbi:hypothetical protein [Vibrio coralliilyticus]|nr:hypothetical protein [Vibrio coralliilyticus]